jgi:hypothetical protein
VARKNEDELGPILKAALLGISAVVLYKVGRAKGREDIKEPHLEAQSKPVIDVETVEESENPAALALPIGNSPVSAPVLELLKKRNSITEKPKISHSPDFRIVVKMGEKIFLHEYQGMVIQRLWDAWEKGSGDIPERELMRGIGSAAKKRLSGTFKSNPKAMKALISSGSVRGTYRLNTE